MQISTVLKNNRSLGSIEEAVIQTISGCGGRYNRAALCGAYTTHTAVIGKYRKSVSHNDLHRALNTLSEKGLINMNMSLELVLDQDELEIFKELAKNLEQYQSLIQVAVEAQKNSWSPYSQFKVGAAILTSEGKVIPGTNFENASYGVTICAERAAIGTAVTHGYLNPNKGRYIKAVTAVLPNDDFGRPCGACRQAIYEFSPPRGEAYVVMANPQGQAEVKKIKDELPHAFGPFDLGIVGANK